MKLPLDAVQCQETEALFKIGEKRYQEEPVIVGQIRRNVAPGDPAGWSMTAIAVNQRVARKIRKMLEAERVKLSQKT